MKDRYEKKYKQIPAYTFYALKLNNSIKPF